MSTQNITLQINLSPGDINYAELTVPALVQQHESIEKRLLVVDCCRPQKTKLIDPEKKFPEEIFKKKVEQIVTISETLKEKGVVSDVYYLKQNDPLFKELAKKYLRNIYDCTHSAGGTANMSYWAGIELSKTPFVLHYDGDLILHQQEGFSWVDEALILMEKEESAVISVPRLCPPVLGQEESLPSLHEGRPNVSKDKYWLNDFFSTRHFLLNKARLEKYLPLPSGKVLFELLLRKYGRRAFPIDPEMLMYKSIGPKGGRRMVLKSDKAWFTHPTDKPFEYIEILPELIKKVSKGEFPEAQRGYENIKLQEWIKFLKA